MDASRTLKNRRGIAIVYIALLLFALVGFAALVIDVGYFYVVKAQLQNAADSAALAGASGLKGRPGGGNPFANETSARIRAQYFAAQNKAAGTPVALDQNTNNDLTGDIVIGCWNNSANTMNTGCNIPNSVQVNARRSTDADIASPINTFFGKIFNINTVNIKTTAVAMRPTKPTVPLAICSPPTTGACGLPGTVTPGPFTFYFLEGSQGQNTHLPEWTTGWTEFSTDASTKSGPDSPIAQLLRREMEIPENVCNQNISTTTGNLNVLQELLNEVYLAKRDATLRWKVILPIFQTCPAIAPAGEANNYLINYASGEITNVNISGAAFDRSFTVENITCMDCSSANFLSDIAQLVK